MSTFFLRALAIGHIQLKAKSSPGFLLKWFGSDWIGAFCSGQGKDCSVLSTICGLGGKACRYAVQIRRRADRQLGW